MKHTIALLAMMAAILPATAQLKPRPDAFPPEPCNPHATKAVQMATTVDAMASWDRYPTYPVYVEMMQRWAADHPTLCTLDTIGTSVQGRLILAVRIAGSGGTAAERPEFFYSSSIHGDELTGYVMMLRLIDTLLASYGDSPRLTDLVNEVAIYINPLANPDGAYRMGNHTVQGAMRYNANYVDLNRNFPDPFSTTAKALPQENAAMIDYVSRHRFRLSANLHGGAEVLNYPWDSFTSAQRPHPQSDWWQEACRRFVDTARARSENYLSDVTQEGYIAGGDWYVIGGGRQDYMNYYHDCLELTMEISSTKTPAASQLPEYWRRLSASLIGYMEETLALPTSGPAGIAAAPRPALKAWPNPTTGTLTVSGLEPGQPVSLLDAAGRPVATLPAAGATMQLDLAPLPKGAYLLSHRGTTAVVLRR